MSRLSAEVWFTVTKAVELAARLPDKWPMARMCTVSLRASTTNRSVVDFSQDSEFWRSATPPANSAPQLATRPPPAMTPASASGRARPGPGFIVSAESVGRSSAKESNSGPPSFGQAEKPRVTSYRLPIVARSTRSKIGREPDRGSPVRLTLDPLHCAEDSSQA